MIQLKGITWDHERGHSPLAATAAAFEADHPHISIQWDKRSLQAFGDASLSDLSQEYDLLVIDHPHVGEIARRHCVLAMDGRGRDEELTRLAEAYVGPCFESYCFADRHWALPIDAACHVAAYRPDLLSRLPTDWRQVMSLASEGKVLWPIKPVDSMMSFFTLAANAGAPCCAEADQLIGDEAGLQILELMRRLAERVPSECLYMSPIDVLERLSSGPEYCYCPLLFGYCCYGMTGFRQNVIRYGDIPAMDGREPGGAILGGAGIAVSAHCLFPESAMDYAFFIANPDCQRGPYVQSAGQPAARAAWEDSHADHLCNGFFRDTRRTMDHAWLRPRYDGFVSLQSRGGELINACLSGQLSMKATLDGLHATYRNSCRPSGDHHEWNESRLTHGAPV